MQALKVRGFRRLVACLPILILAEASLVAAEPADPHLWLEDIEGERALAWVEAQNRESEARLAADPRFAAVEKAAYAVYAATDRIPYAGQAGQRMLNFWQDEAHVRGLLRSAERQAYLAGEPQWETLLDIDQLAEAEGENWVYKGAECLEPDASRCLLMLSRGGGDAVVVREYDLDAKRFVKGGFVSSEAKQSVAWLDVDRLLIAKAGDGFRATDSGYGAELRLWRRGEPLQASQLLLDVPADHVAVSGAVLNNALGTFPFAVDAPTFFEEDVYYLGNALNGAASPQKLPLPPDVDWRGLFQDRLIGLTRSEWLPATGTASVPAEVPVGEPTGTPIPAGTLFSVPLSDLLAGQLANVEALVRPTARRAVTGVRAGRSSLYVSVTEDVVMQLLELSPQETGWSRRAVQLPANGSLSIVSATPHSDLALVNFEAFLKPDTLYAILPGKAPNPVAQLPARFDAAKLSARQTFATSSDGVKVPCFVIEPKGRRGPLPTLLYGYGGFEIALTPSYLSPLATAWLQSGGVF
ncbi:MAG: S9 family peptidase, partial [Gammaproteobacteria bacterium]|nr:S9 family peptidase [Gammaproteobacteria bacterium]